MKYGIYRHVQKYKLKDGTIKECIGYMVRQRLRPNKHISIHRTLKQAETAIKSLNVKVNNREFDHNRTFTRWSAYEEQFKYYQVGDHFITQSLRESNRICWALRRYSDLHGKDWIVNKRNIGDDYKIVINSDT